MGLKSRSDWHQYIYQPTLNISDIVSYLSCQPLGLVPSLGHRRQKPTPYNYITCYLHPCFLYYHKASLQTPPNFEDRHNLTLQSSMAFQVTGDSGLGPGACVCTCCPSIGRSAWQVILSLTFQDKWPSTVYTGFCVHSCFHFMLCLRFHQCHVIFTFSQIEPFYFLLLRYCYITGMVWAF